MSRRRRPQKSRLPNRGRRKGTARAASSVSGACSQSEAQEHAQRQSLFSLCFPLHRPLFSVTATSERGKERGVSFWQDLAVGIGSIQIFVLAWMAWCVAHPDQDD